MEWTRSETLSLALESCTHCHGLGVLWSRGGESRPCNCVLRAIFRICYNRFQQCMNKEKYMSRVSLEHNTRTLRRNVWCRKDEEYIADFYLVSKRSLTREEYRIFSAHFLLGADWKLCCRKLNTDRGTFFHLLYRLQAKLGRIYRELRPYGLYPLDEYFGTVVRAEPAPSSAKVVPFRTPLRPPTAMPHPEPKPQLQMTA
jgi:hypothetical protein